MINCASLIPISNEQREIIVVVDDTPANLTLLVNMLGDTYDVRTCVDGNSALQLMNKLTPDLILLDVMMPGMSGFEVCEKLLQNPETAAVPVIFITALNDFENEMTGLKMGAVDYIAKPFNATLVRHRVDNQLRLVRYCKKIAEDYEKLQQLESQRDDLTRMIIHDLRSPLSGVGSTLEYLQTHNLLEDDLELIRSAGETVGRLHNMITSLLDISRFEEGKFPVQICSGSVDREINKLLSRMNIQLEQYDFRHNSKGTPVELSFDPILLSRIVQNLLDNAVKFTPKRKPISISVEYGTEQVAIHVKDSGLGIAEADQQRVFEKFTQLENGRQNTRNSSGLGLTFCKLAMEAMGGAIHLESVEGEGCDFILTLPINGASSL